MRKATSVLLYGLFVLTVLYPVGAVISSHFGYTFVLFSPPAFAVATAVLSLGTVVLDIAVKNAVPGKVLRILMAVITPLSLINALFFLLKSPQMVVIVSICLSACCCVYFSAKYGRPLLLMILALLVSALMVLPIAYLGFFSYIFGNFGENTVVRTLESPSGEYCAQIIDSDQGGLGGNTFVEVQQKSIVNAILFRIEKAPQRVYSGDWREHETMQIYWKDDHCLIINSAEYLIE